MRLLYESSIVQPGAPPDTPLPPPEATNQGGPPGGGLGGQWCLWRRRHSLSHQDVIYRPALTLLHSQSLPLIFCDPHPLPPTPLTALLSLPLLVFQVCREKKRSGAEKVRRWEKGTNSRGDDATFLNHPDRRASSAAALIPVRSDGIPEVQQKMFLCFALEDFR